MQAQLIRKATKARISRSLPVRSRKHVVRNGELLALRGGRSVVRVLAGTAWLSHEGKDHILAPGDSLALSLRRDRALISALGGQALTVTTG